MSFNFEIGTVPPHWRREDGAPKLRNSDFREGPRALVMPAYRFTCADDPMPNIDAYVFYEEDVPRVRAWLDWFMTEYDE